MKVLSLFSGVGGFDLGLENAGMETVFQCEWDKHATKILERHWPHVPKWTDVSTLTGAYVLQHAPVIDVVAWGSPCQDLSVAGKRAGLSGKRSGLFHEGIRIIKEIRELTNGQYPRISIWENVAGTLSSGGGNDFGQVLDEMDEAGACFSEWRMLDAQYFGVPQRRRRVFVVSVFDPATAERCPNPLLPVSEGVRWNPSQGRTARETVARTVEEGPVSGDTNPILIDRAAFNQGVNAKYDTRISNHPVSPSLVARGPHAVAVSSIVIREREGKAGGGKGPLYGEEKSHSLIASNDQKLFVAPIGFSHTQGLSAQPSETAWPTLRTEGAGMAVAYDEYNDRLGGDVHHALRAGTKQSTGVIEPTMAVRRLTPIECERLMGWPDDWTAGQSDTHRYKQCGNGVASPVAQWIGEQIINL